MRNLIIEQEANFAAIPCVTGDKAYRKDLQDAVDSATGARKRAEKNSHRSTLTSWGNHHRNQTSIAKEFRSD